MVCLCGVGCLALRPITVKRTRSFKGVTSCSNYILSCVIQSTFNSLPTTPTIYAFEKRANCSLKSPYYNTHVWNYSFIKRSLLSNEGCSPDVLQYPLSLSLSLSLQIYNTRMCVLNSIKQVCNVTHEHIELIIMEREGDVARQPPCSEVIPC